MKFASFCHSQNKLYNGEWAAWSKNYLEIVNFMSFQFPNYNWFFILLLKSLLSFLKSSPFRCFWRISVVQPPNPIHTDLWNNWFLPVHTHKIWVSMLGGGQKNKKFEFELAEKLPQFSWLSWFQKYKNQLWTPSGSAASGTSLLSSEPLKVKI